MAKKKKACRVCGRLFTPCAYCENDKTAFHYRTICCSRECAEIYLMKVLEARGQLNSTKEISENSSTDENGSNITENNKLENQNFSEIQTNSTNNPALDKPKRKYTKKKNRESENKEQIE